MRPVLLVALWLATVAASCGTPAPPIREERIPDAACDARVLDLNRRLCAEARGVFTEPGGAHCGACTR